MSDDKKRLSLSELEIIRKDYKGSRHLAVEELLGHIDALEAELARLKSSDQVAEDVKVLSLFVASTGEPCPTSCQCPGHAALSRLAAKAQGYDAALADNAALLEIAIEASAAHNVEHLKSQPHPGAGLLEKHRKALVHARNEGLEKVAKDFMLRADVADEYGHRHTAEVWRHAASAARAMKESES